MDDLRLLCENTNIDIICVSETWFREGLSDSIYKLEGFKLNRADRTSHAGVSPYM